MIYALAPVTQTPSGGVQVIYRHVDILNKHGIPAAVAHNQPGYRPAWFPSTTPIVYWESSRDAKIDPATDILLLPEVVTRWIGELPGVRKVMFCQSLSLTFVEYKTNFDIKPFYYHPDVIGAICVSDEILRYLQWSYPKLLVQRIYPGIDSNLFRPREKLTQISYMPRKQSQQAVQVFNLLRHRGGLIDDLQVTPIAGMTQAQTARVMGDSAMFFHFADVEGFSLPAAEAMASGCVVIGSHGVGGREFFLPEHSFPVDPGDVLQFLKSVQRAIELFRSDRARFDQMGSAAREFIAKNYSLQREEESIIAAWKALLAVKPEARQPEAGDK